MNDLAEKALDGLDAARRAIACRPVPALSAVGLLLGCVVVWTGGRIGAAPAAVPIDRWLGLLPAAGYRIASAATGLVMLAAIAVLLGLWLLTVRIARRAHLRVGQLWTIAACWAMPFAVGPPLLSTDVFGYVARGMLARDGLSPYRHEPSDLGPLRIVAAIDPTWRGSESSAGPLASLLEHTVFSLTGSALPAVLAFRAIAVLSLIVIGRLACELAGPRRSAALALTVLNPAALLVIVSAAELVGLLVALLLAALLAANRRRWTVAVVLVALAAAVNPVALFAIAVIVVYHAVGHPARRAWRLVVRDSAIAAVVLAACTAVVPHGLGWLANLGDAIHEDIPFAPSSAVSVMIGWVVPAAYDDLQTGGRIATAAAGVAIVVYLIATVRSRPLERTLGYVLLAVGVLAPVVYPAFLLWGVLCLAPTATGVRRDWVLGLSCAACVLAPVGLGATGGRVATSIALGVIALAMLLATLVRNGRLTRRSARAAHDPRAAGGHGGDIAGSRPLLAPDRRDVDSLHHDLQHRFRLHGGQRRT
jgi:hypothetical protein